MTLLVVKMLVPYMIYGGMISSFVIGWVFRKPTPREERRVRRVRRTKRAQARKA